MLLVHSKDRGVFPNAMDNPCLKVFYTGGDRQVNSGENWIQRPVTKDNVPSGNELSDLLEWARKYLQGEKDLKKPSILCLEQQKDQQNKRQVVLCRLLIGWTLKDANRVNRLGVEAISSMLDAASALATGSPVNGRSKKALDELQKIFNETRDKPLVLPEKLKPLGETLETVSRDQLSEFPDH